MDISFFMLRRIYENLNFHVCDQWNAFEICDCTKDCAEIS